MTIDRWGSGGPWEDAYGYSRVVRAGGFAITAGCTAAHEIGAAAQARAAFRVALDALAEAGVAVEEVAQTRMYVVDRADADAVGRVHAEIFGAIRPAATMVIVAGLLDPAMLVEVEVVAVPDVAA
jgi:enamine deaminase RidA (YjgF/YER057c/UK114 family)